jgi:energy-converting hydrogenase Eha subunit E
MNKKNLVIFSAAFIILLGCTVGSANNPTMSAVVNGTCNQNMSNGATCNVTLTYNTNGVTGLTLGFTTTPSAPAGQFVPTIPASCSTAAQETQSCIVPVKYTKPTNGSVQQTIVFTLGGAKSNGIVFTGIN